MTAFEDLLDFFRSIIPCYFVLIVPLLILISPIDPVKAAQQFTAFRLQQYDIQGFKLGSRSSAFNFEAQTSSSTRWLSRKCLLLKIMEVSAASIKLAISQNVGSIIILLPQNRNEWDKNVREHVGILENELLMEDFAVPIYFAFNTPQVQNIYDNVQQLMETTKSSSAAHALVGLIMSNGYQLYTSGYGKANQPISDFQIINFYGKLAGNGIEEQLPTILIVAHYDALGMAPSLSFGFDSNGSGVVIMLQLMRLLSRLYAVPKTQSKYNVVFLLSGGGKLNFIGTKKWLEELHDLQDGSLSPDKISVVICLDRLGLNDDGIFVHVSKPPKEGTSAHRFIVSLERAMKGPLNTTVQVVHKRINLNEDELHWEHERFSLRKMSALTLSAVKDRITNRRSILDDNISVSVLTRNCRAIADSLVRVLYGLEDNGDLDSDKSDGSDTLTTNTTTTDTDNITDANLNDVVSSRVNDDNSNVDGMLLIENRWVSEEAIRADLSLVTKFPRSQQLLDSKHVLLVSFEKIFNRYLQNVRKTKVRADPRDPEFVLFSDTEMSITAHKVKPALFDFMVACAIVLYLGFVYLFIENFTVLSRLVLRLSTSSSKEGKHHNQQQQQLKDKQS